MASLAQLPQFLTLKETAEYLRMKPSTLRNWRSVGRGPVGYRVGGRVVYAIKDIEIWLASCRDVQN